MQRVEMTPRSVLSSLTRKMKAALLALGLGMAVGGMTGLSPLSATPARAEAGAMDAAMDTVLVVRSADADDRFLGSAFLYGEDALVAVTNAHVVGDAEEVRLIDRHGNEETATVIATDPTRDVAVIAVKPGRRGLVTATEPAALGLEVYALGAPLGIEFTLTEGLVSSTARQVEIAVPIKMLQHDAAVNPGSSGGPLVDAQGRLLGMNSQIADGSRMFVGIAYAIAAPDLDRIVNGLIAETLAPFPKLGMTARPVDRKAAEALGVAATGLLVDGTVSGGLAAAAGLMGGDIILSVDGTALAQPGDFAFLIEAAVEKGTAMLTLRRGQQDITLSLSLVPAEAEDTAGSGLKIRDLPIGGTAPEVIKSYRLGALGILLGDEGQVKDVTENSPALFAGLARGDRILAVNGTPMDAAALEALELSEPALILVQAPGGETRHIYLDPWGKHDGARALGGANVLDPAVVVF
jgi:serine protease Do